jgi:hypothetical protein
MMLAPKGKNLIVGDRQTVSMAVRIVQRPLPRLVAIEEEDL